MAVEEVTSGSTALVADTPTLVYNGAGIGPGVFRLNVDSSWITSDDKSLDVVLVVSPTGSGEYHLWGPIVNIPHDGDAIAYMSGSGLTVNWNPSAPVELAVNWDLLVYLTSHGASPTVAWRINNLQGS